MNIAILASWSLVQKNGVFYIPATHFQYLRYISSIYEHIYLISPFSHRCDLDGTVISLPNIEIIPLPSQPSYVKALKNFRYYYRALKSICNKVDIIYCRVPDPFSWMPKLVFGKETIMHFVGDTIDATLHNEKWSTLKKMIMITGYYPDYLLTIKAARKSCVYTNGHHLVEKLSRYRVTAKSVISSTIFANDLKDEFTTLPVKTGEITLTYIGFLRYAKGIHCLLSFCEELNSAGIRFKMNLIGNGEMMGDIKKFIAEKQLHDKVILHGFINDRKKINEILKKSDIFFFPSLSEGSPRVVIEAMAQGVPVMSTPVGSLPTAFADKETIRFFPHNDAHAALDIVQEFIAAPETFVMQRNNAFRLVKDHYTIEAFLSQIFTYEK